MQSKQAYEHRPGQNGNKFTVPAVWSGSATQPLTVVCKMEAQLEYVRYTLHTCFCMFGADLYAKSVLSSKISASELGQKFIKSALLVG